MVEVEFGQRNDAVVGERLEAFAAAPWSRSRRSPAPRCCRHGRRKGLEFDAVLVVEPGPLAAGGAADLYVAPTWPPGGLECCTPPRCPRGSTGLPYRRAAPRGGGSGQVRMRRSETV
jgi:hypothetical protein